MKKWTKKMDEKNDLKEQLRESELNGSDGWELISALDYQAYNPEEIEQRKDRLEADMQKVLDNL